ELSQSTVAAWLRGPFAAVPMALFVIAAFRHGVEGLRSPVDDYVHNEGNRIAVHYLLSMAGALGTGLALFALARIAFGAAA
ncbi:MAG: succinate dehydrogenase, hydrophobic membrane anchor protein, partial [Sphingomicrobium sp.]